MGYRSLMNKLARLERDKVRALPPSSRCPWCLRLREDGLAGASHVVLPGDDGSATIFCKACFANWRCGCVSPGTSEPGEPRYAMVRPGSMVEGV